MADPKKRTTPPHPDDWFASRLGPELPEGEGLPENFLDNSMLGDIGKRLTWTGANAFAGSRYGLPGSVIQGGLSLFSPMPENLGEAVTSGLFAGAGGPVASKVENSLSRFVPKLMSRAGTGIGMNIAGQNIGKNVNALSDEDTFGLTGGSTGSNVASALWNVLLGGVADRARSSTTRQIPGLQQNVEQGVSALTGEPPANPSNLATTRFQPGVRALSEPLIARQDAAKTKLSYVYEQLRAAKKAQADLKQVEANHDMALDKADQQIHVDKINLTAELRKLKAQRTALSKGYDPTSDSFLDDTVPKVDHKTTLQGIPALRSVYEGAVAAGEDPNEVFGGMVGQFPEIGKTHARALAAREEALARLKGQKGAAVDKQIAALEEQLDANAKARQTKISKDLGGDADPALRTVLNNKAATQKRFGEWADTVTDLQREKNDLLDALKGRNQKSLFQNPRVSDILRPNSGEVAPTTDSILGRLREASPEHITALYSELRDPTRIQMARNVILKDALSRAIDDNGHFDASKLSKSLSMDKLNALFEGGQQAHAATQQFQELVQDADRLSKAWQYVDDLKQRGVKGVFREAKASGLVGGAGMAIYLAGGHSRAVAGTTALASLAALPWQKLIDAVMVKDGKIGKMFHQFAEQGGTPAAMQSLPALQRWFSENATPVQ